MLAHIEFVSRGLAWETSAIRRRRLVVRQAQRRIPAARQRDKRILVDLQAPRDRRQKRDRYLALRAKHVFHEGAPSGNGLACRPHIGLAKRFGARNVGGCHGRFGPDVEELPVRFLRGLLPAWDRSRDRCCCGTAPGRRRHRPAWPRHPWRRRRRAPPCARRGRRHRRRRSPRNTRDPQARGRPRHRRRRARREGAAGQRRHVDDGNGVRESVHHVLRSPVRSEQVMPARAATSRAVSWPDMWAPPTVAHCVR